MISSARLVLLFFPDGFWYSEVTAGEPCNQRQQVKILILMLLLYGSYIPEYVRGTEIVCWVKLMFHLQSKHQ